MLFGKKTPETTYRDPFGIQMHMVDGKHVYEGRELPRQDDEVVDQGLGFDGPSQMSVGKGPSGVRVTGVG